MKYGMIVERNDCVNEYVNNVNLENFRFNKSICLQFCIIKLIKTHQRT